ncbi:MAG: hypothetical protein GWO26_21225, partial [Phycisphaerae bacterium]|nr:hypothetical protein [Phycisphaerae bacterium]
MIRIGDASQQGVVGLYNWAFTEIGVVYISGDKWYTTNNVGTPVLLSDLPDPQDDRWYHVHTDVNYTTGVITISIDGTTS